jgi:hypothetical protein
VLPDDNDGPPDFDGGCPPLDSGNVVFGAGAGLANGTGCEGAGSG